MQLSQNTPKLTYPFRKVVLLFVLDSCCVICVKNHADMVFVFRINVYILLPYTHLPLSSFRFSQIEFLLFIYPVVKFTFCPYLFLHAQVKHVDVLNNKSLRIRGEVRCISSTCSIFLLKSFISFLYSSARRPGHLSYCYLMGVLDQYLDFEKNGYQ